MHTALIPSRPARNPGTALMGNPHRCLLLTEGRSARPAPTQPRPAVLERNLNGVKVLAVMAKHGVAVGREWARELGLQPAEQKMFASEMENAALVKALAAAEAKKAAAEKEKRKAEPKREGDSRDAGKRQRQQQRRSSPPPARAPPRHQYAEPAYPPAHSGYGYNAPAYRQPYHHSVVAEPVQQAPAPSYSVYQPGPSYARAGFTAGKAGACHACGQMGHFARDPQCPLKAGQQGLRPPA